MLCAGGKLGHGHFRLVLLGFSSPRCGGVGNPSEDPYGVAMESLRALRALNPLTASLLQAICRLQAVTRRAADTQITRCWDRAGP